MVRLLLSPHGEGTQSHVRRPRYLRAGHAGAPVARVGLSGAFSQAGPRDPVLVLHRTRTVPSAFIT